MDNNKTILIIDDAANVRMLAKKILQGIDVFVFEAEGVDEGIQQARENRPDLILLDWEMPGKSGGEFLTARSTDPDLKNIPILILSGKDEKFREYFIELGANAFLSKPFRPNELLNAVKLILDGKLA